MKFILAGLFLMFSIGAISQENFNLEFVSQVDTPDSANDVWGFVGNNGKEYAVVCTKQATKIFDISEPISPILIDSIAGSFTVWRDAKSYNGFVYVTTDGSSVKDGLLIIDVRDIENKIDHKYVKIPVEIMDGQFITVDTIQHCHNIYIDEKGYAYLAGCDVGNRGVIILDLTTDPLSPNVVGVQDFEYAHDVFVRNDLMYSSEVYAGVFSIYDITDRTDPKFLASASTSLEFTHNAWPSDDGNYLFTTDEKPFGFVDAFDISDFNNIKKVDSFQPPEASDKEIIPHNTHFLNDYLITSWYSKGVVITDVSRPDNMIQVGAYDTYLEDKERGNGCWGVYPYLPSGLVLATDRTNGFFIFRPSYNRAAFLEGMVSDKESGMIINEVSVEIAAAQANIITTNALGEYKTGLAKAGSYDVSFSHKSYETLTVTDVELKANEVTVLNVELTPLISSVELQDIHFSASPNPFKTGINLNWSTDNIDRIDVYSINGQLIEALNTTNANRLEIGNDYKIGTYILKIYDNKGLFKTHRIFKK